MGKKKKINFRICLLICSSILVMNSCHRSLYDAMHPQKNTYEDRKDKITYVTEKGKIIFFAKDDKIAYLTEESKIIFNQQTDSIFNIQGKEILVRTNVEGAGFSWNEIEIYYNQNNVWRLLSTLHTSTINVSIEIDEDQKEMIFKSKSKKRLMKLSFDALLLTDDW